MKLLTSINNWADFLLSGLRTLGGLQIFQDRTSFFGRVSLWNVSLCVDRVGPPLPRNSRVGFGLQRWKTETQKEPHQQLWRQNVCRRHIRVGGFLHFPFCSPGLCEHEQPCQQGSSLSTWQPAGQNGTCRCSNHRDGSQWWLDMWVKFWQKIWQKSLFSMNF